MTKAYIEGVRRNFLTSSAMLYSATLMNDTETHIAILLIERHEAETVVAKLNGFELSRPHAASTFIQTMNDFGWRLVKMLVYDFFMSPKYLLAVKLIWNNESQSERTVETSIRPGELCALAVLSECEMEFIDKAESLFFKLDEGVTPETYQIFDLLKREQIIVPEEQRLRLGHGKRPMVKFLAKEIKQAQFGKAPTFPEEKINEIKREYIDFILAD